MIACCGAHIYHNTCLSEWKNPEGAPECPNGCKLKCTNPMNDMRLAVPYGPWRAYYGYAARKAGRHFDAQALGFAIDVKGVWDDPPLGISTIWNPTVYMLLLSCAQQLIFAFVFALVMSQIKPDYAPEVFINGPREADAITVGFRIASMAIYLAYIITHTVLHSQGRHASIGSGFFVLPSLVLHAVANSVGVIAGRELIK